MNSGSSFDVLNPGKVCRVMNWCSGDSWPSLHHDHHEVVDGHVLCIYFRSLEAVGSAWSDSDSLTPRIWLLQITLEQLMCCIFFLFFTCASMRCSCLNWLLFDLWCCNLTTCFNKFKCGSAALALKKYSCVLDLFIMAKLRSVHLCMRIWPIWKKHSAPSFSCSHLYSWLVSHHSCSFHPLFDVAQLCYLS